MKGNKALYSTFVFLFFGLTQIAFSQKDYNIKRWVGKSSEKKLEKNFDWFRKRYKNFTPDSAAISVLRPKLPQYTILVFAGIWCGDSKRILPQFYKTMHEINMPENKISLYLLDEDKESPKGLEKKHSIQTIPTFILFKEGKIMATIQEEEITSIEKDLAKIISQTQ